LFVARFFFLYFYSYPIIGTQGEYFSERIVANYIERNPDKKIIVYASEPRFMFETVLVFNNLITKETIASITTAYQEKKYSLDNFLITNTCYQPQADSSVVSIVNRATPTCDGSKTEKASTDTAIPSLIDSGAIYRLYNDSLCSGYPLGTFSHISTNNFYVEKLTNTDFCSSFFTRE
ncbi:hypothetical protein KC721_03510, partial [Candidatus Woesebacteria bacterium]|nr:hypothetical protein [Candidatus Woesebacteria bacterium]